MSTLNRTAFLVPLQPSRASSVLPASPANPHASPDVDPLPTAPFHDPRGAEVRRYVAEHTAQGPAPERVARAQTPPQPMPLPRSVFAVTKTELAKLPRDASAAEMRSSLSGIIDSLVSDGTWLPPLMPLQEYVVEHGFLRPSHLDPITNALIVPDAAETREWAECGTLAEFRGAMRDFARGIAARYPAGHPQRGAALAAGYEAFAEHFFAHIGTTVPYAQMGTRRDEVPDWVDLISVPYALASRDPHDIRSGVDCDGFSVIATEFFESAGLSTFVNLSMASDAYHKQGIAADADTVLGFSNGDAVELPPPGDGELGVQFRDWVRERVRRPDLGVNPQVFENRALHLQAEARMKQRR